MENPYIWCQKYCEYGSNVRVKKNTGSIFPHTSIKFHIVAIKQITLNLKGFFYPYSFTEFILLVWYQFDQNAVNILIQITEKNTE